MRFHVIQYTQEILFIIIGGHRLHVYDTDGYIECIIDIAQLKLMK